MAGRSFVGARHPAVNFVSFEFLGFLGAVYVFHWLLPQERARKWLLTVASYLFYAAWDWRFCFLMLFVTVNAFAAGHLLLSFERSGRKLILAASTGVPRLLQVLQLLHRERRCCSRRSWVIGKPADLADCAAGWYQFLYFSRHQLRRRYLSWKGSAGDILRQCGPVYQLLSSADCRADRPGDVHHAADPASA